MPGAEWFPGARLNYAQHILRRERPGADALYPSGEQPLTGLAWPDLGQVRVLATRLRDGRTARRPGRLRMPNIPQTVVAMLATTSIGAVWAGCSPDFGGRGASDRFGQLHRRCFSAWTATATAGDYDRGARWSRSSRAARPGAGDPTRACRAGDPRGPGLGRSWPPAVPGPEFGFEQVPFDHPLWVLFSSGTTGLPKAITHSHGGILIEQLKLRPQYGPARGDRLFFYTTSGWMMWNFLVSSLLLGVTPLLYDGHPAYPEPGVLWEMAQNAAVTMFGASPAYVAMLSKAGVVPAAKYDLSALATVSWRLAGVAGVRRVVLPQRQARPVAALGQRRHRRVQRVHRRRAGHAGVRRRAPGAQPRRGRLCVQRPGQARHRRGR